ncbi:hypothetical protein DFJ77DRAFT_269226 [Powellomyces hirtus]|nr:hypothetical protein DFJ77DRAFT_269226 [Powellomyces hirtus]
MSDLSLGGDPVSNSLLSDLNFLGGTEVETPTRFLKEFINFQCTPGLVTRYLSGDFNPFEQSFRDKVEPTGIPADTSSVHGPTVVSTVPMGGAAVPALNQTLWNPDAFPAPSFPGMSTTLPNSVMPYSSNRMDLSAVTNVDTSNFVPPPVVAPAATEEVFISPYPVPQFSAAVPAISAPVGSQQFGLHLPDKRQRVHSVDRPLPMPSASYASSLQPQMLQTQISQQQLPGVAPPQMVMPDLAMPMHMSAHPPQVPESQQPFFQPPQHVQSQAAPAHSETPAQRGDSNWSSTNPTRSRKPKSEELERKSSTVGTNASSPEAAASKNDEGDKEEGSTSKRKRKGPPTEDEQDEKRKRFLERNRVAASKCRMKKKQWLQDLETKSSEIGQSNRQLQAIVTQLKEEVMLLKSQLLLHRNCTCNVIQQYISTSPQFSQQIQPVDAAHQQHQQRHHPLHQ